MRSTATVETGSSDPTERAPRPWRWLMPMLAAALLLRVAFIGRDGYWWDEGYSVRWARMPLGEMLADVARADFNPPLYYALLHGWVKLFGPTEAATRMLSALLSVVAVGLVYAVGARLLGRRGGLVAAALATASAFQVVFAQETRAYALMAVLVLGSMSALLRWVAAPTPGRGAAYVAVSALLCYAHAYGGLFVVAQDVWVAALAATPARARVPLRRWLVLQAALAVALVPYGVFLLAKARQMSSGFWIDPPTAGTLVDTLRQFAGSRPAALVLAGLALAGLAPGRAAAGPGEPPADDAAPPLRRVLLASWLLVPVLVPVVLSLVVKPLYVPRYAIGASSALLLLAAAGIERVPRSRGLRAAALALACAVSLAAVHSHFTKVRKQPWREAVAYIEDHARPDDVIVVSDAPGLSNMLGYYLHRTDVRSMALAEDVRQLDEATLAERLATLGPAERVWMIECFQVTAVRRVEAALARRFPVVTATPFDGRRHLAVQLYQRAR